MTGYSFFSTENMQGISVVIPLFNKEKSIYRSIQSVLEQTGCPFEIIVVDDGSTDQSTVIVAAFQDKRIRLIHQDNSGPAAARNNGARLCRFDYLIFLDADDLLPPHTLATYKSFLQNGVQIDLCLGSFVVQGDDMDAARREMLIHRFGSESAGSYFTLENFDRRAVVNIGSGAFAVKKSYFFKAGGFDQNLHCWEITDFLIRANLYTKKKLIINAIVLHKFETASNSQFQRTRRDLDQRLLYARNILSYLTEMPGSQRDRFLLEVRYAIRALWMDGEIKIFKKLSAEYRSAAKSYGWSGGQGKLYWLSYLPCMALSLVKRLQAAANLSKHTLHA